MIRCGDLAVLRPPCDADEVALMALRNDVETQTLILSRARPADRTRVRQWVRRHLDDPTSLFFVVADPGDNAPLGFVQLAHISAVDGTASMGVALAPSARGRGVATAALDGLFAFAKATHRIRKVCLEVRADHTAAIALYERLGFSGVGVHRDHVYVGGAFVDVALMEKFL